jgi:hypothetical protein
MDAPRAASRPSTASSLPRGRTVRAALSVQLLHPGDESWPGADSPGSGAALRSASGSGIDARRLIDDSAWVSDGNVLKGSAPRVAADGDSEAS